MMKVKVQCKICLADQPHLSGMRSHYENKHPKETWSDDLYDFGAARTQVKTTPAAAPKKPAAAGAAGAAKTGTKKKNDLSFLDEALK